MALLQFEQLSFAYPSSDEWALKDITFSMEEGEYLVVCGESGCGKTTLLKHAKKELMIAGKKKGRVLFRGCPLDELSPEVSAMKIGFVQQNPDVQIVTDTVWRELAFGLENMGLKTAVIRRRVSELASFFGMESWFRKKTSELSGGQKQMLNLAAVLVMNPDLLILDEPTSMLDPLASKELLDMIYRVNRELGIAVLLCEHHLEDVFSIADRILLMEKGAILKIDEPQTVVQELCFGNKANRIYKGLPAAVQIFGELSKEQNLCQLKVIPMDIRGGRKALKQLGVLGDYYSYLDQLAIETKSSKRNIVLSGKELWFRYSKDSSDVIRSLDFELYKGEVLSLVGGNGSGKSTLLKLLSSVLKPYKGKIKANRESIIRMLPQSPQAMFTQEELVDDLAEAAFVGIRSLENKKPGGFRNPKAREVAKEMAGKFGLLSKLSSHPFDLSGGELQRAAIAKLLLTNANVLLLDEPTKGLDGSLKEELGEMIRALTKEGVSVLVVTHDLDFAAEYSDRIAMLFDGMIISVDEPHHFFDGNRFYTTAANQIAGESIKGAISVKEVIQWTKDQWKQKPL